MPAKPIQISLDAELLERIDKDPEALERGRSALIRSAVEVYLRVKERKNIEKQNSLKILSIKSDMLSVVINMKEDFIRAIDTIKQSKIDQAIKTGAFTPEVVASMSSSDYKDLDFSLLTKDSRRIFLDFVSKYVSFPCCTGW